MSKNAVGLFVLMLSLVGVEVSEGDLLEMMSAVGTVVSFVLMVWNQAQRPDVTLFFFKRDKVEE